MKTEQQIARFVREVSWSSLPASVIDATRRQLLADLGAAIAGASADGCEAVVALAKTIGGTPEASILFYGGKVPASQAALANSVMARALDICDAAEPGAHPGTAIIPAALATAELVGGVSGADFLTAVAVGTEIALRFNLGQLEYDGFDPTGVCVPLGSTAAAAKILGLSEKETWNALALAFCRLGGSFQANIDGALAVRMIEGWASETGVTCARLASKGVTGPANFLEGTYGYLHLFGRDRISSESIVNGLGTEYRAKKLMFKKYPSCGATQASTEIVLNLAADNGLEAGDVERVEVSVSPYVYKLVGHPFKLGTNLKVDAQFNIRYCVANALVRKASKLVHFEERAIRDPEVLRLARKVNVTPDSTLARQGDCAAQMRIMTRGGREYSGELAIAPGFPGNELTEEEHLKRFWDSVKFSTLPFGAERAEALLDGLRRLEDTKDAGSFVTSLLAVQ